MAPNPLPRIEPTLNPRGPLPRQKPMSAEEQIKDVEQLIRETTAGLGVALPPEKLNETQELTAKMDQVGSLVGQSIRDAYTKTSEQIKGAVADVEKLVEQIKRDADEFIEGLKRTGEFHANRIEVATGNLKSLLQWMGNQRELINREVPSHMQTEAQPSRTLPPPSKPGTED